MEGEERSGTSSESNERDQCSVGTEDSSEGNRDDEGTEGGSAERDEMEEEDGKARDDGEGGSSEGAMEARELGEGYGADVGREATNEEEADGDLSYPDNLQAARQALRKNSAPSSQIAEVLFSQPLSQEANADDAGLSFGTETEMGLNGAFFQRDPYPMDIARERSLTISSPFRHSPFSFKSPKSSLDKNQNSTSSSSRPRPLSLLHHHPHTNSLPPKLPSLSLSLSPTPPPSPSCASPHASSYLIPRPSTPNSTSTSPRTMSPSSFTFDVSEPNRPLKNRPPVLQPFNPPRDDLLPPLDQPLPTRDWVTIEGDFVLVLAIYQTHLGADLHAAPQARFDDGLIHLTFVRAGISRATLLRLFLAMERGSHLTLSSPYVSHVSARAFRLQPLSSRGTLTVDGELVPYGPLQAQVHPSMARLIVGDSKVKNTQF